MNVFNLIKMKAYPYEERDKNVFYKSKEFKTRIIELPPDGEMPICEMDSYVIFYVISGSTEVMVNEEKTIIKEGECLITEPSTLSMETKDGVKIMGIQVTKE
jgi:quercetin dioxygenase-like cupin family protein